MMRFLGKGWKTITGALLWALAHAGVLATAVGAVTTPATGQGVADTAAKVGAALAVLGLAHKAERLEPVIQGALDSR